MGSANGGMSNDAHPFRTSPSGNMNSPICGEMKANGGAVGEVVLPPIAESYSPEKKGQSRRVSPIFGNLDSSQPQGEHGLTHQPAASS